MSSLMKMFKSKKSTSNKENNPMNRSTIERGSTRSMMEGSSSGSHNRSMTLDRSDVYMGNFQRPPTQQRHHEIHVTNPYSVVTAPKTTKASRSCPGAPLDDRSERERDRRREKVLLDRYGVQQQQQPHQNQYMNSSLRLDRNKRFEFDPYDRSSEYGSADPSPLEARHNRRYMEDLVESDEEAQEHRIRMLEAKISKMKRKYQEEIRLLNSQLLTVTGEAEYYKSNADRATRAFTKAKKQIEVERQLQQRIRRELQKANARVAELEERLTDSGNDSSLLMCSYSMPSQTTLNVVGDTHPSSYGGAGEALCSLNEQQTELITLTHSIGGMKIDGGGGGGGGGTTTHINEDREEDEVRVFRTAETEECDSPPPPPEQPRSCGLNGGGIEGGMMSRQPTTSTLNGNGERGLTEMRRALSDTELNKSGSFVYGMSMQRELNGNSNSDCILEGAGEGFAEHDRQDFNMTGTHWGKEPYVEMCGMDSSSASSDEDRCAILERQLRKKGELYKYQPPRQNAVGPRHFRRFGKMERTALAEFEYLQEIPTDVSGMLSSPDGQL